ncbi:MAG: S8 family peptidase [Alphaproteobacteria bacterium]|nr:S8 family peptidase [Alphaproteobacteria bacterium]
MAQHPHLIVPTPIEPTRFTSPNAAPHERMSLPARYRSRHAADLLAKIEAAKPIADQRVEEQKAFGLDAGFGIYLEFESEPNFPLKFESLDLTPSGIELCAVKTTPQNRTQAIVFVPDGKLDLFLRRITDYRDKETKPRVEAGLSRPKNQDLVESISDIKIAAMEALWTEETLPFPDLDTEITWELWLRRASAVDHLSRLRQFAPQFQLLVKDQVINFVDRTVVLVRGTAANLSRSIDILGMIAEIRLPKETAAFFSEMMVSDQQQWIDELLSRTTVSSSVSPYICLFDTGLNAGHPLLSPVADPHDLHTYRPAWGVDDREGHGTPMAGLAVYGDLTEALSSSANLEIGHRLESVKIVNRANPHDPELYGAVTQESTYRVEVTADRKRVFCMAVTAQDGRDRGRPSSWSAAIDALAAGVDDGPRRLMLVSAGNTDPSQRHLYANSNLTDGIHDPAQAWNALTVGGCTDKFSIDSTKWPDWNPLAQPGDLSPCSCTSMTWGKWAIKPDIVMEAGNMGTNPAVPEPDYLDDLQLLSASHSMIGRGALTTFGDTSAATALAARLAAMVWSKYPGLAPETVRALLVHSAEWSQAMRARFTNARRQIDYRGLLRCFGHGTPNMRRLLSSLDNSLTLIAESEIQPFYKDEGDVKTRDMNLHALPWPREALEALQNAEVSMRVTLSYFIEPSPGSRGWTQRYGYQSHGLRFAVRKPLETDTMFQQRINKFVRDDDYQGPLIPDPGWDFGRRHSLASLGSIHSDTWRGRAIDLAARGHIAVYPTMGWWNKRPHLGAWDKTARYSLIVSLETPDVQADLYTPVANQIGIPVVIET